MGIATATLGFVIGAVGAYWTFFTLVLAVPLPLPDSAYPIFGFLCLGATVCAITGAAILLGGAKGLLWLRLGCALALAAIWFMAVSAATFSDDPASGPVTQSVRAAVWSIVPVAAFVCSFSRTLARWLTAKDAHQAAEKAFWQNFSPPPR